MPPVFQPVMSGAECIGFLLRTARGIDALDADGRRIGSFETAAAAVDRLKEKP